MFCLSQIIVAFIKVLKAKTSVKRGNLLDQKINLGVEYKIRGIFIKKKNTHTITNMVWSHMFIYDSYPNVHLT